MASIRTEERHAQASHLDLMEPVAALQVMAAGQQAAARAVDAAVDALAAAATLAADAILSGGRLIYAGAGSSGLIAMVDALELPGTYGLAPQSVVTLLAGGSASLSNLAGGYEDDVGLAQADVSDAQVGPRDCLVAVSASGSTPYALAALAAARAAGARTVAMANNPGAPLFAGADVAILLETPPEVVAGSTRMGAGTAQKIAFNMFSTLIGIRLGHVHDGHMVNLKADNAKLRARAARIVADIARIDPGTAAVHVEAAGGSVKVAVLLAAGVENAAEAQRLLDASGQMLRGALTMVRGPRS